LDLYDGLRIYIWEKTFLKAKGDKMGDKGKRDKGKREDQKESKRTLKEKRKEKKEKRAK